jgi:DNA polymerase I-like protein with 3'-5' exonuclease and polymerase domains
MKKFTKRDAFNLFLQGSVALAQIEGNGMRIDTGYLDKAIRRTDKKIKAIEEEIKSSEAFTEWKNRYKHQTKIGSREQLGDILHNVLKIPCKHTTPQGKPSTTQRALEDINHPLAKNFTKIQSLIRMRDATLGGLRREVVNGYYHPNFNLHTARTYRSSSGADKSDDRSDRDFNTQNIQRRVDELAKIIRQAYIPRAGNQIGEIDFKTLEANIGCCYHKDQNMISYLSDPSKDMHRDNAIKLYCLENVEIPKGWWKEGSGGGGDIRFYAKNQFVFAEFYGSYFKQTAPPLWDVIDRVKLHLPDGTPLKTHLRKYGINELGACERNKNQVEGTFEEHVKKVERYLWDVLFPGYRDWKNSWWEKYLRTGGFDFLTGFRAEGIYSKNQVTNYCVQGAAFHCLLFTLIRLQRWLLKHKMKSKIIGQIHDSMLLDLYPPEIKDVLARVKHIVSYILPKEWDWIIVPLNVEMELAPIDGSWWEKGNYEL